VEKLTLDKEHMCMLLAATPPLPNLITMSDQLILIVMCCISMLLLQVREAEFLLASMINHFPAISWTLTNIPGHQPSSSSGLSSSSYYLSHFKKIYID